jgi:hypothetical protein
MKLIQSGELPLMPKSNVVGRPEVAAICLQQMLTLWE